MRWQHALVLLLVLAGCASSQEYFRPTERLQGQTWRGFPQASYPVTYGGVQAGEAKLWSAGAFRTGKHSTAVQVGFEVTNSSSEPLVLDLNNTRVDVLTEDLQFTDLAPTGVTGQTTIAPRGVGEIEITFDLPEDVKPSHVQAFRLRWELDSAGQTFAQLTPFKQEQPEYYYGPYWGPAWSFYYDPFFWGPGFGWGLGYGYYPPVHHHHHD